MKKILSVLMILLLIFPILSPAVPVFADTFPFPGSIVLTQNDGSGSLAVTVNEANLSISLHYKDNDDQVGSVTTGTTINQVIPFNSVAPGAYYIKALRADGTFASSSTQIIPPKALTLVMPDKGSNSITIDEGIIGATVTLHNDSIDKFLMTGTVNNQKKVQFEKLPVAKGFYVIQTVRGAKSAHSNSIDIYPPKVIIKKLTDAGPLNNTGQIEVTGSKDKNKLLLWKNGLNTPFKEGNMTNSGSYIFGGLGSGIYWVTQVENDLESEPALGDQRITILDQEAPVITLIGSSDHKVTYPNSYVDPGYNVKDNEDEASTIKVEVSTIPTEIGKDGKPYNPPGIYQVTYTATDTKGNKSSITRTVTVVPNVVEIKAINTTPDGASIPNQRNTGDLEVTKAIPGATLYLYKDPSTLIRTITDSNEDNYLIKDVLVGKDYYVIQEINGVRSDPSLRYEIKDTTPPILKLNGDAVIELVAGDRYIEYGATPTDNVDLSSELTVVIGGDTVNVNKPGIYVVTYDVKDKAGNKAIQLTRTITITPPAVIAIGSNADFGEIGVKNAFPGGIGPDSTTLTLYELDKDNNKTFITSEPLKPNESTHMFKKYGPGRYLVIQTVNGIDSAPSNIVNIIDIDRPYITMEGPEKLTFIIDKEKQPYYHGTPLKFNDPGISATDYLEDGKLNLKSTLENPDGTFSTYTNTVIPTETGSKFKGQTAFSIPGVYKITYSAEAPIRKSKADDKHRVITVAPPKTSTPTSSPGTSIIKVPVLTTYTNSTTTVNLYDTYNKLIAAQPVKNNTITDFDNIPAGIGYYVTQTVNGVESEKSNPVNVRAFTAAEESVFLSSFAFVLTSSTANGVIDQNSEDITVTVPKGTDVKKLVATFNISKDINTVVKVNGDVQKSGITEQNFTLPVKYTISGTIPAVKNESGVEIKPAKPVSKEYIVNVIQAKNNASTWPGTITKNINLSSNPLSIALTSSEKAAAVKQGVSYMADDAIIHVSPINVQETNNPQLSIGKVTIDSFISKNDPSWAKNISNAMEIGWGGETKSFLQPIEVELANPTNKKAFARIVRENGKLIAYIQESEPAGIGNNKIVGLATEPGIYALIDDIASPTIKPEQIGGKQIYRLIAEGTIYYTTNSKHIKFDRSARNINLTSYQIDSSPLDLNEFVKYTGVPISTTTGQLYAFVVKDQIVSPITSKLELAHESWNNNVPTVERDKIWNVKFNASIDKKALYSKSIYVKDDSANILVATTLHLSADGKSVSVAPVNMYESGRQYTLWIDQQLKGNTKNQAFLKKPMKITFNVK